ncbi:MAG: hypothetical protein UX10_C0003G0008 [Candidatus Magasanikbacteria bacterium GW2011_GWA2_45_39]|uniref:Uncharacterized protein n=2 Tax=Candidatus Magasanikiibacteriota TaxID=1752731 RepID=A0A0G1PRA0_9BACT|nr:MAG: hypothetical protein UX10_C0003G0008 [Candidatus Magasanikbacteria bacterium GW2011_GWA2_45_39]HBW74207.1 hypothetical protein [Candidatus Magasanikbacteria bacterium]
MKKLKNNIFSMSELSIPTGRHDTAVPVEPQETQLKSWEDVHEMLKALVLEEKSVEVMSEVAEFADSIRSHIPNFQEYRAYHVLSPNSLPQVSSRLKEEDLLGEYAVMPFVQRMQEKYGSHT